MHKRIAVAGFALGLLLGGCDDDSNMRPDRDYNGPPQAIASKRVDPAVMGVRTKSESYCMVRKANGTCSTTGTRVKTETYVVDDEDKVFVLLDGSEADVSDYDFKRYKIGDVYP